MVANVGRTTHIYRGTASPQALVAGVREKTVSLAGDPVDITNDDSLGWRQLLDIAGINSVEISCSGVALDGVLRAQWYSGSSTTGARMQPTTFRYPDGGEVTGNFYLSAYSETGVHDKEITFEGTFMSSGTVTYTPGP